jgi:hypothetical protein
VVTCIDTDLRFLASCFFDAAAPRHLNFSSLRLIELRAEKAEMVVDRCVRIVIVKKSVLSLVSVVALLIVAGFGFAGCGSDDEVETRTRNAALSSAKLSSSESKANVGARVNRQLGEVLATLEGLSSDEFSELIESDEIDTNLLKAFSDLNDQVLFYAGKPSATEEEPAVPTYEGPDCNITEIERWDCATFERCLPANSREEWQTILIALGVGLDAVGCE